jgi:pilus assembly protein CpaB
MFETRRRAFIFLVFSIALALAATVLFSNYMEEKETSLGELAVIYVADKEIPAGERITREMIGTSEIPRKYVTDSYIQDLQDLDGKVSMVPIPQDGIITKPMLRNNNLVAGEYRQVVLRAPFAVFDDRIDVLDQVDLVASYEQTAGNNGGEARKTKVILRDVSVNSVTKKDDEMLSVGVALPLDQADELIWMLNYGKEVRVLKSGNAKAEAGAEEGEDKGSEPKTDAKTDGKKETAPTTKPTAKPTAKPTVKPTTKPTAQPTT